MPEKLGGGSGEQFLNEKYPDLKVTPEVESAVLREEKPKKLSGEKVKQKKPAEKIEAYLNRLEEIFGTEGEEKKKFRVDFVKDQIHENAIIKPEDIPQSYWDNQKRIAREQGHGDVQINKKEAAQIIIKDQQQSLDNWVDYLGSDDATYPTWLKYWAFRSISKLSNYDKEAHEFKKRSKGTTAPFPDINREALAYVLDAVEKQQTGKTQEINDENWEKLLKSANFGKLYAHAIEKITPASEEEKENIQGEWVKYEKGSDATSLYESLQGHGTGWCTAGESTAKAQLELGDFYVFYSKDKQGMAKIPRVAIRMQGSEIAEVRGIQADQNLEPVMVDIAKEKYGTLPGGEKYEKKASDMKKLTEIEKKFSNPIIEELKEESNLIGTGFEEPTRGEWARRDALIEEIRQKNQEVELTKEELRFLYEIDNKIEGFGYQEDPRIEELKGYRYPREDFALIFECDPREVAIGQIGLDAYKVVLVGSLFRQRDVGGTERLKHIIGDVDFSVADFENLGTLESISGRLDLQGSRVKDIGNLKFIGGGLYLGGSQVESLGELKVVKGSAFFEGSQVKRLGSLEVLGGANFENSEVEDLGELKTIEGDAFFGNSKIKSLGNLESIGFSAHFQNSQVSDLGKLKEVKGNVFYDRSSGLDFSKVKVGGKITAYPKFDR